MEHLLLWPRDKKEASFSSQKTWWDTSESIYWRSRQILNAKRMTHWYPLGHLLWLGQEQGVGMKLWLSGDHHTGTTYFYKTFSSLAKATNEKYFTTTAAKEFTPNHFTAPPKIIPQNHLNQYDSKSPLYHNHKCFINAANNFQGGFERGWQRLETLFIERKIIHRLYTDFRI